MNVDFESLSDVLKHPIRRRIILVLSEKGNMSYVDLMNQAGVMNTGKFNYHLKILGDLIEKDQNGKYGLAEKGQLAVQFLRKFPEKEPQQTSLRMADAVLIGFAGCVLTAANPDFWSIFVLAILEAKVPTLFFSVLGFVGFAFALIVPGAVMWLLVTRRTHSHDAYDLFKPPFVTFILLLLALVTMLLLKTSLTVVIMSPISTSSPGTSSYSMMQTSLATFLLLGLPLSFLGVTITEFTSKIPRRIRL